MQKQESQTDNFCVSNHNVKEELATFLKTDPIRLSNWIVVAFWKWYRRLFIESDDSTILFPCNGLIRRYRHAFRGTEPENDA